MQLNLLVFLKSIFESNRTSIIKFDATSGDISCCVRPKKHPLCGGYSNSIQGQDAVCALLLSFSIAFYRIEENNSIWGFSRGYQHSFYRCKHVRTVSYLFLFTKALFFLLYSSFPHLLFVHFLNSSTCLCQSSYFILNLNVIKVVTAPWMTEKALTMRDCMIRQ